MSASSQSEGFYKLYIKGWSESVSKICVGKNTVVEEYETNLMSLVIKFYCTSCMLNMFRKFIHPSSGACDFSIVASIVAG